MTTRPPATATGLRDEAESWPVGSSAELASGRIVALRRDMVRMPDGEQVGREVLQHPGAVAVLAIDEAGQVLMIRQYRHPVRRVLWEIPAGLRDVEGEPLLLAAQRELAEEAGYRAADWHVLADVFTSPGISTERVRIFLARGLAELPAAEQTYVRRHEEAQLQTAWVPLEAAVHQVLAGDLHNGVTVIGLLAGFAALRDAQAGPEEGFGVLRAADAPES
ncbi:MAG TPA: NUDIX hydrolase [Streptosporangiaceae bacterium]